MDEITFQIEFDEASGRYTAYWDESGGRGGISTQGSSLLDLQRQIREAVDVHFDGDQVPAKVRLHFVTDPVLALP